MVSCKPYFIQFNANEISVLPDFLAYLVSNHKNTKKNVK